MSEIRAERVITLDVLRGIAIIVMVFLHNGAFHFAGISEALANPPPWLVAFGFLLLWAGLFGLVSGAANATATLRRLERERARSAGAWHYPPSLLRGAFQTFAILFVLHLVWTLGTGNSAVTPDPTDPTLRVTLIPGLIYYGFFPRVHPENWVFASALWMIGANVLGVSLLMRWRYRREPPRPGDGLDRTLLAAAAGVLAVTPLLRALLFPTMMEWVQRGGAWIAAAVPLALLVNDPNPVFPFLAYGLMGAVVGAALARGEPRQPLYVRMGAAGAVLLAVGAVGIAASGGLVVADREHIWGQSALYFASLANLLLGLFCWLLVGLLALFDPAPGSGRRPWRPRWLRPVLRFGRVSLTVFMLEGILAMVLHVGLDAARPGWNRAIANVLLFSAGNVAIWHVLLVGWERFGYRGSLEWWLARIRGTEERVRALGGSSAGA